MKIISKKPSQTTKRILLKFNKPIKRGKSKLDGKKKIIVRTDKTQFGGILDKHVQVYKVWFLFLKLALELENQNAVLVLKDRSRNPQKGLPSIVTKKVKVNREKYAEWNVDQVLEQSFEVWFGKHKHLFTDDGIRVLTTQDAIGDAPHHLYVRIDRRRRATDILKVIKRELTNKKRHETQSRYLIQGNPRHLVLMNKYNALVLKLMGYTDRYILSPKNGFMRLSHTSTIQKGGYSLEDPGRTMFDLISGSKKSYGAKQTLLSVCDGYFPKNPNTPYFE